MARSSFLRLLSLSILSLLLPLSSSLPSFPFTAQTGSGYTGRQQGGLLIVGTVGTTTSISLNPSGSATVAQSALVIFGGQTGSAAGVNDVWYSSNGGVTLSSVAISPTATYVAQSYGPATCVDTTKQILYSVGGDTIGQDGNGTSQIYYSTNLGQSWSVVIAPWPARTNALCLVDSASRIYVTAGKLANSTGDQVSNDVWAATTALSGSTITFSWSQQSAAAPFAARDGAGGATYYSAAIGADVLYVAGGYVYNSLVGQSNDNGLGDNTVWASIDQGVTWTNLGKAQWSPRYHNKMLATKDGVLVSYGGSFQPPPTNGGATEISDVYQNDLWASLDGGFSWGLCNGVVLPAYQNTSGNVYTRGGGRQDVLMQVDPNTGLLYIGSGREYNAAGSTREFPADLYVSTISLFNVAAVASACGLSIPFSGTGAAVSTGLLSAPVMSLVTLTAAGPFFARQQGGLLVVNKTGTALITNPQGSGTAAPSALIIFGGEVPNGKTGPANDVWYSTSGQSWSSVAINGVFASQTYGPATCVDANQQVLYVVGGDSGSGTTGDQYGTSTVQWSVDLGQTWQTTTATFQGRANSVCYVDSFSRLVVIAGKWSNTNGVAVSNDVWLGTPSAVPPTAGSTWTWSQQSAAAPFSPRDGPLGATYFSTALQQDVYYLAGGYAYQNSVAQFDGDNGVGDSEVWASLDQGQTWKLIANNQFPARYHGKMLATQDGVLVIVAGANAPPTYAGGSQQHSSYLRNDMWASLDGGFTWGQCATQLFPLASGFNASLSNSFARGTGREDPLLAIDPATGYLYMGQGLQRDQTGNTILMPTDLYRSSISFYSIGQVAGLCGDLAIPAVVGLQSSSLSQVTLVQLTAVGPFSARQQGGLYVVDSYSADTYSTVVTPAGTITAQQSALVIFGGEVPNGKTGPANDVWYSTSGQSWSSVAINGVFASQTYGPATCVDANQQVLYVVGGDSGSGTTGDQYGTSTVQWSVDLGQTWQTTTATFQGRANSVCYVDSFSRLVVIAGKWSNTNGVAVSNDVWLGTPSAVPPTAGSTWTWSQQSAAAPFSPRDGPLGATYFSTALQQDVYYLAGGYAYQNSVAQFDGDNGVGDSEVWASLDQGQTWKLIANNQFPARYHGKMLATQDGVLVIVAGANAPPTYAGGSQQHSSYLRNDMWASLDGGFTWGQCATQLFPLASGFNASLSNSFARGTGREDPLLAIDPATGYLYMGQGLQRDQTGNTILMPTDLYRSSISFYSIGQVAGLCGDLAIPAVVGLQSSSLSQVTLVQLTAVGPFSARQQGGLYVVDSYSADTYSTVVTPAGTITAQQSALVIFGGEVPNGKTGPANDVWYSTSGQSWSSVAINGVFASQTYGPATCVDANQQVLYVVGGDSGSGTTGDQYGTSTVQWSVDLGQTWQTTTATFQGRANSVCYVDSFSRLVVIAGKWSNTNGVAVSNDVWLGTPSAVPPTAGSTWTWSQQSAAAPFSPRDGPLGATYFSTALQQDVYYLAGGYAYQNSVAQFDGDNGVGDSEVWASLDQGQTWKLIANNQFPARYHGKMLATQDGVLVIVAGANAPPTYAGGSQQHSSYLRNDMWASLDGGFTWGQCATQLFPLASGFNASLSNSFARGTGREDPLLAIDPATGYLYMGQGLQRDQTGNTILMPTDLYRSSISFYSIGQVAGLCGDLAIPAVVGLQSSSLSQVTLVQLTAVGPFSARQQGGLYVVDSYSADTYSTVVTPAGTITAQQSALVIFGGEVPNGKTGPANDVWYSTSGQSWSSVAINGVFASQTYGPATCVDANQQVLYVVGGDSGSGTTGDQYGTSTVQWSVDLGQTWQTTTATFQGRANSVCYVDSSSRLVVIAGKWSNTNGVAVSNDVWLGTPSAVPPTAGSTWTWSQQSAAAPFSPRDGPLGATYFSTALQQDVYYLAGGYAYQNSVAQFDGDNGVGDSEVWASLDQGQTWKLIANNQFPARYHGKMLATQDGVLVIVAGANAPPTYAGGSQQHSSYLRNDMWASLDGGFTWGQCATQLFPLASGFNASLSNSFARGTGREDPLLAIDPATGYLYMGQGLQRDQTGNTILMPTDLYRSSISFYSIGQVAGLCGDLAIPAVVGLQSSSLSQVTLVQLTAVGPFSARQQGGLYVVDSYSADTYSTVVTPAGTITAQQSALVIFGGEVPNGKTGPANDVWYSTSGQSWSSVAINGVFASQTYGPATCVDANQQVLYVVGGDSGSGTTGDQYGTSTVQWSVDLGQTWQTTTATFQGRANSVCYVDSFSRLVVIAGKWSNTNGVAVSNDVWLGTPSAVPPTAGSTWTWSQQSAAAPFSPRDGPLGATYFSTALQQDVYYLAGGYAYQNSVAQFDGDNGVGDSEVWASLDQGQTWKLIANNQFPARYHGKMLATQDGVLVIVAGANAPPTYAGGSQQHSSYLRNDMWASLDGGFTWGQCATQLFPLASGFNASLSNSFARGTGREDPLLAIDPATGYLYMGQGLQRDQTGNTILMPTDLYRSSISFYSIGQVAGLCGDLAIPAVVGLQSSSLSQVTLVQLTAVGPFSARQQGGLYVVDSYSADTYSTVVTPAGTITAQQSALVIFGGEVPNGKTGPANDVWYSTSGQSWSSVAINGVFASQTYGPATCVDANQQVLYVVGGDSGSGTTGDQYGTSTVQWSVDLGQTWQTTTATFQGRANSVCYVDSSSRLVVIAGKWSNTNGVAVSNDVWLGTPSAVPPTAGSTWTWSQQSAAAPFSPRDGPLGATYFSTALQQDVYYLAGGYAYQNSVAQFDGDNGVGDSEVWASLDQGQTWKLIANNQFPARYHGKMLATQDGVLVIVAGANAPPTYAGGSQQHSSYLRNDMWASLDGGFTWGQCATQLFPLASGFNASLSNSFARGTGREDPLLAIDPATGYLYMGQGLQRDQTGNTILMPTDLYRSSISFYSIGQVAGLCGDLAIPAVVGLQSSSLSQVTLVQLTAVGPFSARQQGGLYVVDSYSADTYSTVVTPAGTITAQQSALVIFGGEVPNGKTGPANDVWYSTSGQSWSSVAINGVFASQTYGPATCVDANQQVLYVVGGDSGSGTTGDQYGTSTVQWSVDLGQTWQTTTATFQGRANSVCYVDSFSRLVVIAGKWSNTNGVAVSNDVWLGTPSAVPPTAGSTWTWSQQSAAAPFSPRDGPLGATYFSTALQQDVYYLAGGYAYQNSVAQFDGDNGVGDSEVWASLDQGQTWKLIANNQFPARYHGKMLATQDGVLVIVAGANAPPTYAGGSQQHSSYLRNDMWASLDGGFTWGQCATQLFPLASGFNASLSNSFARGTGREDPLLAIDPATGYLYMGQGLQRDQTGNTILMPTDLYRSSISFYSIGQVAGLCGDLAIPAVVGLQQSSISGILSTTLTLSAPFTPRQQGGMYIVNSFSSDTFTTLSTSAGTAPAALDGLVVFGGHSPLSSVPVNDVWYSSTGGSQWSAVTVSGTYASEAYGPSACVDINQQVLYSVGGDASSSNGDQFGTSAIQFSVDLGQTWATITGAFPGRANAVCYVDSYSRLVVIGGKLANSDGVAVSNDVWLGTPSIVPPTLSTTFTWSQQTGAAPFQARDGSLGATYFSTVLNVDVYYVMGGYEYENATAQSKDNGVGTSEVWASIDQGVTWKQLSVGQLPPRYHGRLLATQSGVLVVLAGANAPPTTDGGATQGNEYLLNDMWASVDGGYTWGQCSSQVFPNASTGTGSFPRGTGREDPLLQIDTSTGYLYYGAGLQWDASGTVQLAPADMFRSAISFFDVGQVAGLCGQLNIPAAGAGIQQLSVNGVLATTLTLSAPFTPRQQGGMYIVNSFSSDTFTTLSTSAGTAPAALDGLVVFGGHSPLSSVPVNDVWYSSTGGSQWSAVTVSGTYASEAYGPSACVDINQQVLYSVGGDASSSNGDQFGTSAIQFSVDLGQTWATITGAFPGRANAVCYVDSYSRLVVIGGKLANSDGVAVSNDVWLGTPSIVPPTLSTTFTWSQQTGAAPFQARDGSLGATYFSTVLNVDVYYVMGGYEYENATAQSKDNGVGTSEVWASIDQGVTWKQLSVGQLPPRYHGRLLATQSGVLVVLAGANAPPTTDGGATQGNEYLLNDMWASVDGGYTWGQCSSQVFPNASTGTGSFPRGTGREDPLLQIDTSTGYLYYGAGLQWDASGTVQLAPADMFRSAISFFDIGHVAGLCGGIITPVSGTGLFAPPSSSNSSSGSSSSTGSAAASSTSTVPPTSTPSNPSSSSTVSTPTSGTGTPTSAGFVTSPSQSQSSSSPSQVATSSSGGGVVNSGGGSGLSHGAIAGVVIGSVVGAALLLALCILLLSRRGQRKQPTAIETSKVGTTNRPHNQLEAEPSENTGEEPASLEMVEV